MGDTPSLTDPLLEFVLEITSGGLRAGLTVVAEGAILTGQLVPVHEYLAVVADDFAKAGSQGDAALLDELRQKSRTLFGVDEATAAMNQRRADGAADDPPPVEPLRFVHLVNARVLSGPTLSPASGPGVPMRIRVSAVSAWWFGSLQIA